MAIPVIASSTTNTSTGTNTVTLSQPSGTSAGNLLVIVVGNDYATDNTAVFDDTTYKPDNGFTLAAYGGDSVCDAQLAVYWKIATGSESWPVTVTGNTSSEGAAQDYWAICLRITGAHATTPINVINTVTKQASTQFHTIAEVTTTVDDCLAFFAITADGGDVNPIGITGTGWSKYGSDVQSGTSSVSVSGCVGTKDMASQGLTGDVTAEVFDGTSSDGSANVQFAIAPAAATASTAKNLLLIGVG